MKLSLAKFEVNNYMTPCSILGCPVGFSNPESPTKEWFNYIESVVGEAFDDPLKYLGEIHPSRDADKTGILLVYEPWNRTTFSPSLPEEEESQKYGLIIRVNVPRLVERAQKEGLIKDYHESS